MKNRWIVLSLTAFVLFASLANNIMSLPIEEEYDVEISESNGIYYMNTLSNVNIFQSGGNIFSNSSGSINGVWLNYSSSNVGSQIIDTTYKFSILTNCYIVCYYEMNIYTNSRSSSNRTMLNKQIKAGDYYPTNAITNIYKLVFTNFHEIRREIMR